MSQFNPSGLDLSRVTEALEPVDDRFNDCPIEQDLEDEGGDYSETWDRWFPGNACRQGWTGDLWRAGSSLRRGETRGLSFQRKIRIWESTVISTDWAYQSSYEENPMIQTDPIRIRRPKFNPSWRVFGKVCSSLWRWGCSRDHNTAVAAFNAIPKFSPAGFTVLFDHASHSNERGYAAYNRDHFYDGPLAYVLHWDGKPVAVTSFAVMADKKLGITQIQLLSKKGNRFLYKVNLKESVLDAFRQAFDGFEIGLVTGDSLAKSIAKQYRDSRERVISRRTWDAKDEQKKQRDLVSVEATIQDFTSNVAPRLHSFYASNTGQAFNSKGYVFAAI